MSIQNHTPTDERFWERIADRAEELANLCRPHSRKLTRLFELAALYALEMLDKR
ncbi:hypothetical protein [Candidatus Viadribacter manganicus]|uniref:hypothetical protein n=1 Tax=Candidatus Viadribacter manganicus TaxID=1759059 RepID=UPI0012EA6227|nr:hypothetical protein [Candidatus Viadribacter manganicus]